MRIIVCVCVKGGANISADIDHLRYGRSQQIPDKIGKKNKRVSWFVTGDSEFYFCVEQDLTELDDGD